uniref:Uncharacterized protein n=1 Tax=Opuntia streptacantha TaxID=393608 RepID=A0A7C9CPH9_OPUST
MPSSCVHTKGFRYGAYCLYHRDMREIFFSHIVIYNIVAVLRVLYVQLYFIIYYSVMVMKYETCWLHGTIFISVMYHGPVITYEMCWICGTILCIISTLVVSYSSQHIVPAVKPVQKC